MTNAEYLEDFAADWDSEVSKRTSERLMSCAAELRAAQAAIEAMHARLNEYMTFPEPDCHCRYCTAYEAWRQAQRGMSAFKRRFKRISSVKENE